MAAQVEAADGWLSDDAIILTTMHIGEALEPRAILAKRTLSHGTYQDMVRGQLPFAYKIAHKIRSVAQAVE